MMIQIRTAQSSDLAGILAIQAQCYQPDFLEDAAAFRSKINASASTCWLAIMDEQVVAYLVSVPVDQDTFPALNAARFELSKTPTMLYWHDMAVHPAYRRYGVAQQLANHALQQSRLMQFKQVGLIAVQSSSGYWLKHGFVTADATLYGLEQKVSSFGEDAVFMQQTL